MDHRSAIAVACAFSLIGAAAGWVGANYYAEAKSDPVLCRNGQSLGAGRFRLTVFIDVAVSYAPFRSTNPWKCPGLQLNFLADHPMEWGIKTLLRQEAAPAQQGSGNMQRPHFIVLTVSGTPHWDERKNGYRFDVDRIEGIDDRG